MTVQHGAIHWAQHGSAAWECSISMPLVLTPAWQIPWLVEEDFEATSIAYIVWTFVFAVVYR